MQSVSLCMKSLEILQVTRIHINLFITQFVITRFWIQHGSKIDKKMYRLYRKMTINVIFLYNLYILFGYNIVV